MRKTIVMMIMLLVIPGCTRKQGVDGLLKAEIVLGVVTATTAEGTRDVTPDMVVLPGTKLVTGPASRLDLRCGDSGLLTLNENSELIIDGTFTEVAARFKLEQGGVLALVPRMQKDRSFQVQTVTMLASVRGTAFAVTGDKNSSSLEVVEGRVLMQPVIEGRVVTTTELVVEDSRAGVIDRATAERAARGEKPMLTAQPISAQRAAELKTLLEPLRSRAEEPAGAESAKSNGAVPAPAVTQQPAAAQQPLSSAAPAAGSSVTPPATAQQGAGAVDDQVGNEFSGFSSGGGNEPTSNKEGL